VQRDLCKHRLPLRSSILWDDASVICQSQTKWMSEQNETISYRLRKLKYIQQRIGIASGKHH